MAQPPGFEDRPLSVADQIRALAAEGHARADIARMLGKRYQHVRNVLEADRLQPKAPALAALPRPAPASPFKRFYRMDVAANGTLVLPPEVLAALGGDVRAVVGRMEGEDFCLTDGKTSMRRAQDLVRRHVAPGGPSLVDELIADRRREAQDEDSHG